MKETGLRIAAGVAAVATVVVTAGPVVAKPSTDQALLLFDDVPKGAPITSPFNAGTARVTSTTVTLGGGQVIARRARALHSRVAEFPAYDGLEDGARAVISVRAKGKVDGLEPGRRPFVLGADVQLDEVNVGTAEDNGNNVLQRGRFNNATQFKLQVDHGRFGCRVKGSDGVLVAESKVTLKPTKWYRARCTREFVEGGERLVLKVRQRKHADHWGPVHRATSDVGAAGELSFRRKITVSVGGKLGPRGSIAADTDQFNGRLDNVFLHIR